MKSLDLISNMMELLTIQDSFEEVINDVKDGSLEQDKFWIAKRNISLDTNQDFWYIDVNKHEMKDHSKTVNFRHKQDQQYEVDINGVTYNLQSFYKNVNLNNTKINSLCISGNSERLTIGTLQGELIIFNLRTSEIEERIKEAHFGNIVLLRFFPSDKAILSVGIDLQIKIWGIDGQLVRTMSDQVKDITSINFLGKTGRNFISGSKDGSINIWECGSGLVAYRFNRIQNTNDLVNCCVIGVYESSGTKLSDLEFETANNCAYVGYESGIIQQFNIGDHCQTKVKLADGEQSGVSSIDIIEHLLVSGYKNGQLKIWDITKEQLVLQYQLNTQHPISKLNILKKSRDEITVLVYNGPETLLKLTIELTKKLVKATYLVGMEENFRINDISINRESIAVGGDELKIYK